jgi:ABC-type amino acid transport substrate-binding protein
MGISLNRVLPLIGLLLGATQAGITQAAAAQVGAQPERAGQAIQEGSVASAPSASLTIATRHAPPFAFQGADGQWSGIAIDLWNQISANNGYDFRYIELGLPEMLEAVATAWELRPN